MFFWTQRKSGVLVQLVFLFKTWSRKNALHCPDHETASAARGGEKTKKQATMPVLLCVHLN